MKMILGTRPVRYLPAIAVILFAGGFLLMSYHLRVEARAMPLLVGWVTLVLAIVDLVSRTGTELGEILMRAVNPAGSKERQDNHPATPPAALLSGVALIVALVTSLIVLGVLPTTALFIFGALIFAYRDQWLVNALTAAAATLGVWLLFAVLLRLQLYPGLAFGGVL